MGARPDELRDAVLTMRGIIDSMGSIADSSLQWRELNRFHRETLNRVLDELGLNPAMAVKKVCIQLEDRPIEPGKEFDYVKSLPIAFAYLMKMTFGKNMEFQSWVSKNDQGKRVGHIRVIAPEAIKKDIVFMLDQYNLKFFIQEMLPKTDIFVAGQEQKIHYASPIRLEYATMDGKDKILTISNKDGRYYENIDGFEKVFDRDFSTGDDTENPAIKVSREADWITFKNIRAVKPISLSYEIPENEVLDRAMLQPLDENEEKTTAIRLTDYEVSQLIKDGIYSRPDLYRTRIFGESVPWMVEDEIKKLPDRSIAYRLSPEGDLKPMSIYELRASAGAYAKDSDVYLPVSSRVPILVVVKDKAQSVANGGIDLNQIKVRRNGKTVNVQFDPAQLNELMQGDFKGFTPVIINISRIQSPFQLLGIRQALQEVLAKL